MSTGTDNQSCQAGLPTELAHRHGDGIEVLLLWDRVDGRLTVVVDDLRGSRSFELAAEDGRRALDAFYHPFAYAAARRNRSASSVSSGVWAVQANDTSRS
jgi:hypothetical protein